MIEKFEHLTFINLYFFFTDKNHKCSAIILRKNGLIIDFNSRYLFERFNFILVFDKLINWHVHYHWFTGHFSIFLWNNFLMASFAPYICLQMYSWYHLCVTYTSCYVVFKIWKFIDFNHILVVYKNVAHIWIIFI